MGQRAGDVSPGVVPDRAGFLSVGWQVAVWAKLYGGYFVLDIQQLLFSLFLGLLLAAATALLVRGIRGTSVMLAWLAALWAAYFLVTLLVLKVLLDYPVFRIHSIFELP